MAFSSSPSHLPRDFPTSGFQVIDPSDKVEEENLPFYNRDDYYPMRMGEVIGRHYQVVAKLGYGTTSTVWLGRDLRDGKYWTLKVHINTTKHNQESAVYRHLADVAANMVGRPGRQNVRELHDSLTLTSQHGDHEVFVMTPLGMSLRTLQQMQPNHAFEKMFVTSAVDQVLFGLYYLHAAELVHTDLHSDNLLVAIVDNSVLADVEEGEIFEPAARKRDDDRFVYVSRYMLGGPGPLTICDFGQARIGNVHRGLAMPLPYRAPEVILRMDWGAPVDLWAVGLLSWSLLKPRALFDLYAPDSPELNDAHHLAAMTALMGPPPPEFLQRSEEASKYWSEDGTWKGPVPVPTDLSFESLCTPLTGQDKEMFLNFLSGLLHWLPEERLTTEQTCHHLWLRGGGEQ
ncbi:kinase-like protein [Parathielavia hyrcaniae]|uniref:Kinase-like protein n=1 Tax=Parathielavia hyrcaniae TaxID=113614 RepID=A0AAN6PWT8_9PEZI|nr:kinase-like protein [Parathielavia hyrcaniae]